MKLVSAFLASIALIVSGQDELTPETFDSVVDGSKSVFAMFYAPWCGHCKNFKPEYRKVAASYADEPEVAIVSVDADQHKDLKERFGVTGFVGLCPIIPFLTSTLFVVESVNCIPFQLPAAQVLPERIDRANGVHRGSNCGRSGGIHQ